MGSVCGGPRPRILRSWQLQGKPCDCARDGNTRVQVLSEGHARGVDGSSGVGLLQGWEGNGGGGGCPSRSGVAVAAHSGWEWLSRLQVRRKLPTHKLKAAKPDMSKDSMDIVCKFASTATN